MRLTRLDLTAYGPFTGGSLDLSAPGMHVVVGPNEAGKSSALNAICDALYGIPARTTAAFLHQMPNLQLGFGLELADGTTRQFVRLKKQRDTLRSATNEVVPEAELQALLRDIDRDTFTTSFGLTHERLLQGSKDLAAGRGELGKALFGASSGSVNLSAVLEQLEQRADEILRPSGRAGRLHELTKQLETLRAELRESQLRPRDYVDLVATLRELEEALHADQAKEEAVSRELQLSQTLLGKLAQLRQWRTAADEVGQLEPSALPLRSELPNELDEARSDLAEATESLARETAELERLETRAAEISVDSAVLELHAEIDGLRDRRAEYESKVTHRSTVTDRLQRSRAQLEQLLRRLRPDSPPDEAASAVSVGLLVETTATTLVADLPAIDAKRTSAQNALNKSTSELDELSERLAELPAPPESAQLRAALSSAQSAGDLDADVRTANTQAAELESQMKAQLSRLGLTTREIDEAAALAAPAVAKIEAARSCADRLVHDHRVAAEKISELTAEMRERRTELDQLLADTHVPSLGQLETERAERSRIWSRVRTLWLGEPPDEDPTHQPSDWDQSTDQEAVASAYESAVATTDSTADRLRSDAATVARRAELERQISELEAKLAEQSTILAGVSTDQDEATADWRALWAPIGIDPESPVEMREWIDSFAEFQRTHESAKGAAAEIDALTTRIDGHRDELRSALDSVGIEVPDVALLPTLITRCQETLDDLTATADERRQLLRDVERVEKERTEAEQDLAGADEELGAWRTKWTETMCSLDLPAETDTQAATAFLTEAADAQSLLDQIGADESEAEEIQQFVTSFEHDADAVLEAIDPERAGGSYAIAVGHLAERLSAAREAQAGLEQLRALTDGHVEKIEQYTADIAGVRSRIGLLVEEAGVDDEAALTAAVELAAQLHDARTTRDKLEAEISAAANGRAAADLFAELGDHDEISLQSRIDRLSSEFTEIRDRVVSTSEDIATNRLLLDAMDGSAAAAEINEQIEFLSAEIARLAEAYQSFRLGAILLQEQVDAFREEHQGPILGKAGPWFRRLTLDSFVGLDVDGDALQGVRQSGERVGVDGMSDGTRDQLYLALRLAAVAVAAGESDPMPLVLDDVLINFDEGRAAAALEILGELSDSTQILLFTHHQHVAKLARGALGDTVTVHPIQPRDVSKEVPARSSLLSGAETTAATNPPQPLKTESAPMSVETARDLIHSTLADAAEPLSKSQIVSRSGIPKAMWTKAISPMVADGKLTMTGQKKGARYELVRD